MCEFGVGIALFTFSTISMASNFILAYFSSAYFLFIIFITISGLARELCFCCVEWFHTFLCCFSVIGSSLFWIRWDERELIHGCLLNCCFTCNFRGVTSAT